MTSIDLSLYGRDVEISASRDCVDVKVTSVDIEHVIEQVEISQFIRYYGLSDILNEIGVEDVKHWLQEEGYVITEEE